MPEREIHCDVNVLRHAINDGINIFVREVLIKHDFIKVAEYDESSEMVMLQKGEIAKRVAESWKTSVIEGEENGTGSNVT